MIDLSVVRKGAVLRLVKRSRRGRETWTVRVTSVEITPRGLYVGFDGIRNAGRWGYTGIMHHPSAYGVQLVDVVTAAGAGR